MAKEISTDELKKILEILERNCFEKKSFVNKYIQATRLKYRLNFRKIFQDVRK
jgi:hypothetical protein